MDKVDKIYDELLDDLVELTIRNLLWQYLRDDRVAVKHPGGVFTGSHSSLEQPHVGRPT